jgi:hypothetical protein
MVTTITLRQWAILLAVARGRSGPWDQDLEALLGQGLIDNSRHSVLVTDSGRIALGLPVEAECSPSTASADVAPIRRPDQSG